MKSCLIVDDSGVIRKIVRQIYEELGFACNEAENGRIALEYCRGNSPDVIMLDWNMPEMSGIEFMEAMQAERGPDLPIVFFCTTEGDMSHIQRALNAGATDYIIKPFDKEMLQTKLLQVGLIDDLA